MESSSSSDDDSVLRKYNIKNKDGTVKQNINEFLTNTINESDAFESTNNNYKEIITNDPKTSNSNLLKIQLIDNIQSLTNKNYSYNIESPIKNAEIYKIDL